MLDDGRQLVPKSVVVVGVAVLVEVESGVDGDGSVNLSAPVINALQLDRENFWCIRNQLLPALLGRVVALLATVSFDDLCHVLLQVHGQSAISDLGGNRNGKCSVIVTMGSRFIPAAGTANSGRGHRLKERLDV